MVRFGASEARAKSDHSFFWGAAMYKSRIEEKRRELESPVPKSQGFSNNGGKIPQTPASCSPESSSLRSFPGFLGAVSVLRTETAPKNPGKERSEEDAWERK